VQPHDLAQAALAAVAYDCSADLGAGGEPEPGLRQIVAGGLHDESRRFDANRAVCRAHEIAPFGHAGKLAADGRGFMLGRLRQAACALWRGGLPAPGGRLLWPALRGSRDGAREPCLSLFLK